MFWSSFFLAIVVAIVFFFLLEKKNFRFLLIVLGVLPVVGIYLNNSPGFRLVSAHGFLHSSIVYKIMEGQIPPMNSLMAGERLIYPWGFHGLCAFVSSILNIAPPWSCIFINVLAMTALLFTLYKISLALGLDEMTSIFGASSAVYVMSPVPLFIQKSCDSFFSSTRVFTTAFFPMVKFNNFNAMGLGMALTFLVFLSVLYYFKGEQVKRRSLVIYVLSLVALGYVYPILLMPVLLGVGIIVLLSFWQDRKRAIWFSVASVIGGLFIFPYLYHLIGLSTGTVGVSLVFDFKKIFLTAGQFVFLFLPLGAVFLLAWWNSKDFMFGMKKRYRYFVPFLIGMMVVPFFMEGEEYKFMAVSVMFFGLLSGPAWGILYKRKKVVCFLIFLTFLYPVTHRILRRARGYKPETNKTFRTNGVQIFHPNQAENSLNLWIRENTDINDVFLDTKQLIPPFTGRSLYIGYTDKRRTGYKMPTWELKGGLRGLDREKIEIRRELKRKIYSQGVGLDEGLCGGVLESLGSFLSDVYFVARNGEMRSKFEGSPILTREYDSPRIAVYKLKKRKI